MERLPQRAGLPGLNGGGTAAAVTLRTVCVLWVIYVHAFRLSYSLCTEAQGSFSNIQGLSHGSGTNFT